MNSLQVSPFPIPSIVQTVRPFVNVSLNLSVEENGGNDFGIPLVKRCSFPHARDVNVTMFESDVRREMLPEMGSEEIIKIIFSLLIVILSLVGNSMVILIVYSNVKMRTTENLYLTNLAVADLLVTIFCTWVHTVKDLTSPHYVLPELFCKLEGSIAIASLAASVFTLTAISIGRFAAIMFPYRTMTRKSHVGKVIALLWIISLLIGSPSAVHRELYAMKFSDQTTWHCDEFWNTVGFLDETKNICVRTYEPKAYFHGSLTLALYFIPVFVMLLSYGMVIWKLWQGAPGHARHLSRGRRNKKVRLAVTVVLVTFVVCWTPLQSIILCTRFIGINHDMNSIQWFEEMEYAAYFLAFSNSALNPIIYCSFSFSFRQGFKTLLGLTKKQRKGFFSKYATWRTMTAKTKETNLANGEDEARLPANGSPLNGNNSSKKNTVIEIRSGKKSPYTRTLSKEDEPLMKKNIYQKNCPDDESNSLHSQIQT